MSKGAIPVAAKPGLTERLADLGSRVFVLLALLALLAGGWRLWQSLSTAPVARIQVLGNELSPLRQQQLYATLQPLVRRGYYTADLISIRDQALAIPWVEQVTVTRAWPNGIAVRPIQRQAIARWGSTRWLSDRGVVFSQPDGGDTRLPMLHGPASQSVALMTQYQRISALFSPVDLRIRDLYLTDRMTWFIQFDNGLKVIVDQSQTEQKLQRLSALLQGRLRADLPALSVIDLRYIDGLAVKTQRPVPLQVQLAARAAAELERAQAAAAAEASGPTR